MTEHLQPGPHLDADQLAAFAEGALADWEREVCMAHLARCEVCRQILFLAQAPDQAAPAPAVIVMPIPLWRRVAPLAVATALAACLVTAALVLRPKHSVSTPTDVAQVAPPPAMVQPAPAERPAAPHTEPPVHRATVEPRLRPAPQPKATAAPSSSEDSAATGAAASKDAIATDQIAAAPAPATASMNGAAVEALPLNGRYVLRVPSQQNAAAAAGMARGRGSDAGLPPAGGPLTLRIEHGQGSTGGLAKISGAVLDPTGAFVPGATVTLRTSSASVPIQVKTDAQGGFNLAGLPPGHYDLQIAAQGFATVTRSLELQASDLALLTSQLPLSADTQTVTVDAAALETESVSTANMVMMDAMTETVTQGKRVLGLGSDGAVSLSTDRGKRWKKVKPQWAGKIVHIAASADGDGFEITTESNAVWLSREGKHWRQR